MKLQENINLKEYTTFKIGGPAKFFVEASTIDEVKEALDYAKNNNLKILFLGGGSNLLVSDQGFDGLVLKLNLQKLEFDKNIITVGAGVNLSFLLEEALNKKLTGLEFVTGIPGTVGGAVRGNAGTYGLGMADVVQQIIYLDEDNQIQTMNAKQAKFAYRHSIFKEKKYIILETSIKLETGGIEAARKLIKERLQYRQDTQPNQPSAGCAFKNVLFADVDLAVLKKKGLDIDKFSKFEKIPAGFLIEQAGLKGHQIGGAQISELHSNYIINKGKATSDDVVMLISFIKQQIRDKYGIQLQEEVQIIA